MTRPSTAHWLLVPLVACAATIAGAAAIFYGSTAVGDIIELGEQGLGVGVGLILGGFLTVAASLIAGFVAGIARRRTIDQPGAAVRHGLTVATFCVLAYLVVAITLLLLAVFSEP